MGALIDWSITLGNIYSDLSMGQTSQVVGSFYQGTARGKAVAALWYLWLQIRGPSSLGGGVTPDACTRDYSLTHLWVRDCCSPGSLVSP